MKKILTILMIMGGLSAGSFVHAEMIQIKGSDTLINLVQKLAEIYMQQNPGTYIAVTGGGSGTGVAALLNKQCDIANASRLLKQKEIDMASATGFMPQRVVVAIDGLSIITNANNSVDKLTFEQVGKIYKGEIKNWKEVGGRDMPISLYGLQPNSGTYDFMLEVVLKGDYSPKMRQMNGNAQIVEAVKADVSGIGYVGVAYVKNDQRSLNVVKIASKPGAEYISPLDRDAVISGTYTIARPLNQYIPGMAQGEVKDFLQFELSSEGQDIVKEEGFFPIPDEYKQFNKAAGL